MPPQLFLLDGYHCHVQCMDVGNELFYLAVFRSTQKFAHSNFFEVGQNFWPVFFICWLSWAAGRVYSLLLGGGENAFSCMMYVYAWYPLAFITFSQRELKDCQGKVSGTKLKDNHSNISFFFISFCLKLTNIDHYFFVWSFFVWSFFVWSFFLLMNSSNSSKVKKNSFNLL